MDQRISSSKPDNPLGKRSGFLRLDVIASIVFDGRSIRLVTEKLKRENLVFASFENNSREEGEDLGSGVSAFGFGEVEESCLVLGDKLD